MKPERISKIRQDRLKPNKQRGTQPSRHQGNRPDVDLLLELDREYRKKVRQGNLSKVAPGQLDPEPNAPLPVLKTERNGWTCTVFYDTSPRARRQNKTREWVVVHYEKDGTEFQETVITAEEGPLKGKRVVRGRVGKCKSFYNQ